MWILRHFLADLVNEFQLISGKLVRKSRFSVKMKKKRPEFAPNHENWTDNQRGNVIFSDESKLQRFVLHQYYVTMSLGKYIIQTKKNPSSQMIFGQTVYISRVMKQLWIVKISWTGLELTKNSHEHIWQQPNYA